MENNQNELVLFESQDNGVKLSVPFNNETVWLSSNQMAELFERDEKTIRKHVNNVFAENEIEEENNTQILRVVNVKQPVKFYSLDVIISVGYRVKSKRGTEFRRWANTVLKQYILKGYAANEDRLSQLNQTIQLIKRLEIETDNRLDKNQILLKEVLGIFIRLLTERNFIRVCRKRLLIFCILLQRIIHSVMETKELRQQCFCTFLIKITGCLKMVSSGFRIIRLSL